MSRLHRITFPGAEPGHVGIVTHTHEWGGPDVGRADCSCGWASPVYDEYPPTAATHGGRALVQGGHWHADQDLLEHLGWDRGDHEVRVRELAGAVAESGLAHVEAFTDELARYQALAALAQRPRQGSDHA